MRVAICDDERETRKLLEEKVQAACPDAEIVEYISGEELLSRQEEPDILLLDIQMGGMDGMETARKFRSENKDAVLIFVTALEEYVFQAFDVGAFHYLVKPFPEEQFRRVFSRAAAQCLERSREVPSGEERSILIRAGGVSTKVRLSDIVYAEVFNRKVTIYRMDDELEFYGRMADLEKQAGEEFYRTHRAYLVNLKYVVKYDASAVWLERGRALIAKGKFQDFVRKYLHYNQKMVLHGGD